MSYNWDALGMPQGQTKASHPLHRGDIDSYRNAVEWIRGVLNRFGYAPTEARLHPEREAWHFYDQKGELVYSCPHSVVERVWEQIRQQNNDGA